jgi:hypothetical protein
MDDEPDAGVAPANRDKPGSGQASHGGHASRTGAESTEEMRQIARRRREAEEKLQQHLEQAEHKVHPHT